MPIVEDHGQGPFPHPDRLFPVEPAVRKIAAALYEQVAGLPLISPHGHVDAAMLARDEPYADPVALLVRPDHYVLRLLHAQGVPLTDLGVHPLAEPGGPGCRATRGLAPALPALARIPGDCHAAVARGRAVRLCSASMSPSARPLPTRRYDRVAERLTAPEMRPRALYRRFGLEVLATTDSPLDDLSAHAALRDDPSWEGRVVPTFRPDGLIDGSRASDWAGSLDRLEAVSGIGTGNYRGYIAALESRRAVFKSLGATATDHGPSSAEAIDLSEREATAVYDRLRTGSARARPMPRSLRPTCSWRWPGCQPMTAS